MVKAEECRKRLFVFASNAEQQPATVSEAGGCVHFEFLQWNITRGQHFLSCGAKKTKQQQQEHKEHIKSQGKAQSSPDGEQKKMLHMGDKRYKSQFNQLLSS